MLNRLGFVALALLLASCATRASAPAQHGSPSPTPALPPVTSPTPSIRVGAFYYAWYGTPSLDSAWIHWKQNSHVPPQDIASDYFPALGPYSSNDPAVVAQHMAWLRKAGIGVMIVSWWGKDSATDHTIPLILGTADRYGIKVAFHIEPYQSRSAAGLVDDVKYLYRQYGSSPAFFRSASSSTYSTSRQPKGMFFIWCIGSSGTCGQQKVAPDYWLNAVDEIHALPEPTLLIANSTDVAWITGSRFDGLYNYSTLHPDQRDYFAWARTLPPGTLYVPSVIPGFSAKRVGYPAATYVARADGLTYNEQWTAALDAGVQPDMLTITSFNEWHEGTMIEPPAFGKEDGHGYSYADFGSMPADGYLTLTRQWIDKYAALAPQMAYRARIQVRTTSDWTTLNLVGSPKWIRPVLVSASQTAAQAGFEAGDRLILTQSLDDANQGHVVEMTWDLQLTGFAPEGNLALQVDRGNIGKTDVAVYGFRGNDPILVASFSWDATTGGRNTHIFTFPAVSVVNPPR